MRQRTRCPGANHRINAAYPRPAVRVGISGVGSGVDRIVVVERTQPGAEREVARQEIEWYPRFGCNAVAVVTGEVSIVQVRKARREIGRERLAIGDSPGVRAGPLTLTADRF